MQERTVAAKRHRFQNDPIIPGAQWSAVRMDKWLLTTPMTSTLAYEGAHLSSPVERPLAGAEPTSERPNDTPGE